MKEKPNLDVLRAIAIILVVFDHHFSSLGRLIGINIFFCLYGSPYALEH